MRYSTDLRRETRSLSTALRKPQVRGRWGELHLRRAVELAGLVDRCDFAEQVAPRRRRPPPRPGGPPGRRRQLVVDAKVPLDAYLDATSTDDDDAARAPPPPARAPSCAPTSTGSSAKRYWRSLPETPEFVVLFVPAESFLGRRARDRRPTCIEYAAARQVVLATPTTLIALLRTVAHGWSHETLAEQAREIQRLGRDLHERLGTARRPPRPGGPLAERRGRPLQPGGGLAGVAGAGHGPPVQRARGDRRRAAGTASGRGHRPLAGPGPSSTRSPAARLRRRAGLRPYRGAVSRRGNRSRRSPGPATLWHDGQEPGRQVVALGRRGHADRGVARPAARRAGQPRSSTCASWRSASRRAGGCDPPTSSPSGCCRPCSCSASSRWSASTPPGMIAHPADGVVQAVVSGLSVHTAGPARRLRAVPGQPRSASAPPGGARPRPASSRRLSPTKRSGSPAPHAHDLRRRPPTSPRRWSAPRGSRRPRRRGRRRGRAPP